MAKLKIFGKANPVVGIKEYYSINDFFGNSNLASFDQSQFQSLSDEQIKWSIWTLSGSSWSKRTENNKTGITVPYTFSQKSLTRKGIRMLVEANGEKAVLDIKTEKATQGKILHVDLLDNNYNKPARSFAYGDWIIAKVHCVDMELLPVKVTLWEDDGDKTKQSTTNVRIETKISDILNGIGYAKFYLNPSHAWLANAKLAKGDKNEGEFHEYYVTAEIFEKISKRVPSKNANVPNLDYKPEAPKKQTPAEKKGPSKKEEKGIAKSDNKVHDYHEQKVSVKKEIWKDPFIEKINSYMTISMGDVWESKKSENCVCREYDLIWGNKVSCDFRKKVIEIAKRLGKDPNLLMAGMALETGKTFFPTAGQGTSYVGLIQFGDSAAESVGTTRSALLKMTAIQQLDYIEKYLEKKKDKINTLTDFYLSILMPVDVGKGNQPNAVVFDNEFPLAYKKDGVTLTDLSKSRHFGYRQNRSFLYEEGESEIVRKGGGKKYDGAGKTYVWEIEKHLSSIYNQGKTNKAHVFLCDKDNVPKSETESGTWNVIVAEKYTEKKCSHEKARNNCRRGTIEVFDHNQKSVLTISDCLLEGWKGEDRMKTDNDTPFGIYQINSTPFIMGSSTGDNRLKYGPNPRLAFEPIKGSGDEADKSKRSAIRIHGGRQEDSKTYVTMANAVLKRSSGCVRIYDSDAKNLYDWWVEFHKLNPKIKPGKVTIRK
jgi:hypothetical protein